MNEPIQPFAQTESLDRDLIEVIANSLDMVRTLQNDICREDPHIWQHKPMQLLRLLGAIRRQMKCALDARSSLSKLMIKELLTAERQKHETELANIDIVQEAAAIIRKSRKKSPKVKHSEDAAGSSDPLLQP